MFKKHLFILTFVFLFCFEQISIAQNFLNGSFEINTSSPCNYNLSNATFTATVSFTVAYGGGGELDIMGPGAGCPYGTPECGNWHIGMAYPSAGSPDAFTMELSAPLVAGNTYTMSFWDKGDGTYPPAMPIQIGVSTVPGATGTPVYTGPVPTINVWNQRIFTFVAPNNGMYISVETTGWRWTHVDDFVLGTVGNMVAPGNVLGSPFCACGTFMFPFTSTGVFNSGNTYSVLLSDASGSFAAATTIGTLNSISNADSILCTIPCNAVAGSLYQLQVVSSDPVNSLSCSGTNSTVNISINAGGTVTVNSPSVCAGQTATLIAAGGTNYTWSAGVTNVGADTANAAPLVTTSYTVTGTGASCLDTAVATVTIIANLPITVNSPTICAGQIANLTGGGASSYTWSAGATSTGISTADASPVATTNYTVTGTNGTCSGTAVSTVTVNPLPVITVNSPSVCYGQTANLTANGGTTYTWSSGTTITGINTADASPVSSTSYTVVGTSSGCSDSAVALVTIVPLPVINVNSPIICEGQTANLVANGGTIYSWSAGANVTGTGTANVTPIITTSYTVTGTMGACSNTAVSSVTVNPIPVVVVNSPSICNGQTASLVASGANTYVWSLGATSTGINTASASPTSTTVYIVTGTSNGCTGTASSTVTVNNCNPVIADFSGNPLTICNSGCVDFVDLSVNTPTNWSWQFPGGVPASANSQGPINVCYSSVGQYTVILIVSNLQSIDTIIKTNYVNIVSPVQVSIAGNTMVNACEPAHLRAEPPGTTYLWGPNSYLSCGNCEEATVTPLFTQDYYCEYTDVNGCYSADTTTVDVIQKYTYFMPTGFSPNADRTNDVLYVFGKGIDYINLKIYDRVGEKVFESSDIEQGWDGTYFGQPMNEGVFVYNLEVTYCNGQTVKEHGSLMLEK